ncbi:MAG: hypothetical protein GY920_04255, partial [Aliivibrio sp.]|nr:hypothetical protein [Aliivibrio sp.]
AFKDGNPEVPSLLIQQLRALRYNNILTGLAPVRAAAGAFTGLIGKPVTTFAGTAKTGDMASFKRATFVYGGIRENLGRAFTALADEWKFAVEAPQLSSTRTRKDFSDVILDDFESMEEMAAAWEAQGQFGKVAVWNMTKGLSIFNNNPIVRSGINAMTAIDGFTKSMSASMSARSRAYDELFDEANGAIDIEAYSSLQKKLYDQSFDSEGLLKDSAAIYASGELNLNLDSKTVSALESFMARVPVAKSIFMFPRTGINAVKLITTFSPTGVLGVSVGKGRAVKKAVTQAEIDDVLVTHGYKPGDNAAFKQLKSEYIGRELMGGAVVMGAALYALDGGLRGSGPADPAERKRMMDMGWQPYTFRDWNGEWRSYQGLEPFDTFLGLTADIVFEGQRMDSAITDEWFQALIHSVTMNVTNKTFLSGFEPVARLLSQDPSAVNRFLAMQTDAHIPGTGVRSILNKAITPQLKDVENNFKSYLANRFKGLPGVNSNLYDLVDIYTGKPINYTEPLTAAVNALLPFGKTNGGTEEWRQKLLASGWDGLQTVRTHPDSEQPMTPEQRNWVNNWIGKNWGMDKKMEEFFEQGDGWAERQLKSYVKDRELQTQSEFPIKVHIVHRELDKIHDAAFKAAFAAMRQQDASLYNQGILQNAVEDMLSKGNTTGAAKTAQQLRNLINASK